MEVERRTGRTTSQVAEQEQDQEREREGAQEREAKDVSSCSAVQCSAEQEGASG